MPRLNFYALDLVALPLLQNRKGTPGSNGSGTDIASGFRQRIHTGLLSPKCIHDNDR